MPSTIRTSYLVRPSGLALILSAIIMLAYFGFILLSSLARPLMTTILVPGISVGVVSAAMVLVLCMLLSLVFVLWSNRMGEDS